MSKLSDGIIGRIRARGHLAAFTTAECHAIFDCARVRMVKEGDVAIHRGRFADEVTWIAAGAVDVVLHTSTMPHHLVELDEGHAIGMIAFLARANHALEFIATRPLMLVIIERDVIESALHANDPLFGRLLMALSSGVFTQLSLVEEAAMADR